MRLNETVYVAAPVENFAVPSSPPTPLKIPLEVKRSVSPGISRSMPERPMSALTLKRRRASAV